MTMMAHVSRTPDPPSVKLGKSLPADVEAVVLRALSKEPCDRYASASELALALADCKLAGKWTFGDATQVKKSSRPPPAGGIEMLVGPPPPRVPSIALDDDAPPPPMQRARKA